MMEKSTCKTESLTEKGNSTMSRRIKRLKSCENREAGSQFTFAVPDLRTNASATNVSDNDVGPAHKNTDSLSVSRDQTNHNISSVDDIRQSKFRNESSKGSEFTLDNTNAEAMEVEQNAIVLPDIYCVLTSDDEKDDDGERTRVLTDFSSRDRAPSVEGDISTEEKERSEHGKVMDSETSEGMSAHDATEKSSPVPCTRTCKKTRSLNDDNTRMSVDDTGPIDTVPIVSNEDTRYNADMRDRMCNGTEDESRDTVRMSVEDVSGMPSTFSCETTDGIPQNDTEDKSISSSEDRFDRPAVTVLYDRTHKATADENKETHDVSDESMSDTPVTIEHNRNQKKGEPQSEFEDDREGFNMPEEMETVSKSGGGQTLALLAEAESLIGTERDADAIRILMQVYKDCQFASDEETTAVMVRCQHLFCQCNMDFMSLKCHYRARLHDRNNPVVSLGFMQVVPTWIKVVDEKYVNQVLDLLTELQVMTENLSVDPRFIANILGIYSDLQLTFRHLIEKYRTKQKTVEMIQEQALAFDLQRMKILYQMGRFQVVCDMCKDLNKCFPENFDILDLWARALFKQNRIDVALKKAEFALSLTQNVEAHKKSDLHVLLNEMNDILDNRQMSDDQLSIDTDDEWLESTNVKAPKEMKDKAELVQSAHVKKSRSRPKRQIQEVDTKINPNLQRSTSYIDTTNITSWKDVTEFDFSVPSKGRGRKRKRRCTGASDVSSTADHAQQASQQKFDDLLDEICGNDPSDDSDVDFGNDSDPSMSMETLSIDDFDDSNDPDDDFEMSMFDRSVQMMDSNAVNMEHDVLTSEIDLSPRCLANFSINEKKRFYADFFPKKELLRLCIQQPEKYKRCTINIESSHNAVCTNLDMNDPVKKIMISGRSKCGKSFTEDEVVVELLTKTKDSERENIIPRLKINLNKTKESDTKLYGKVVGILERRRHSEISHPVFICSLDEFDNHLVKPLCKTIPKIHVLDKHRENKFQFEIYTYDPDSRDIRLKEVKTMNMANRKSYVFMVALINWDSLYPRGAILDVFTANDSLKIGMKILQFKYKVPSVYSPSTVRQVQGCMDQNTADPFPNRTDLESLVTFTIDPPNSQDLDDALSIEKLSDGRYRVGVHIADVSSIVKKDDPVDVEAKSRATSFYPGQGMNPYHMLPEPLSQNKMSLLPDEKRPVISIFLVIGEDGAVTEKPDIKRTSIKSCRKFSYEEVQKIIEEQESDDLSWELKSLFSLATKMRKKRLGNKMHYFPVETELTDNTDTLAKSPEAHYLVEEFMIRANHEVAKFICRIFSGCVPLRCQSPPSEDMMMAWKKSNSGIMHLILQLQDYPLSSTSSNERISIGNDEVEKVRYNKLVSIQKWVWQKMVTALENGNHKEVFKLVGTDGLHPAQSLALEEWMTFMESAEYRCVAGSRNPGRDALHFSLGIKMYTHFTSPIRRYTDIIVHRMVHAALDKKRCPYTCEEVESLCHHVNSVSRQAKHFQKQCQSLLWGLKLQKEPTIQHGLVQAVSDEKITLHFPGLRNLPNCCKEIQLSHLNVISKPMIQKDTDTDRDILTLRWHRRLHSASQYVPKKRNKERDCTRVDPHQRAVYQQQIKWVKLLNAMLEEKKARCLKKIFFSPDHPDVNMDRSVPACNNTELDVSSETRGRTYKNRACDYSMSFNHGQVVAVQMSAEAQNGLITPSIKLFDMTDNVKYCLQHQREPIKTLSSFSKVQSKEKYQSATEYLRTWLPLMSMESASCAAQDHSVTINDVPIKFESRGGTFVLGKSFCEQRDIIISSMSTYTALGAEEKQNETEYVSSSDFLCIRHEIGCGTHLGPPSAMAPHHRRFWLGHAEFDKMYKKEEKGKIHVHFKLHRDSPFPHASMLDGNPSKCCVEILTRSMPDKRTEVLLKSLPKASQLSKAIALGNKMPRLQKDHLDLAKKIEHDVTVRGFPRNNLQQDKAITMALESTFSLIQGPPGTGKTYTGIKLVYLFAKINRILRQEGNDAKQVFFCGPSNKAVDLVAKWLLKKLGDLAPKIVRMYGRAMENKDYPVPGQAYSSKSKDRDSKPDPELRDISLHHLIRQDDRPKAAEIKEMDRLIKEDPDSVDFRKIKDYEKLKREASEKELQQYEVIFCTTSVATKMTLLKGTKGKVYQLIIDEAGMCTEPECLAPIIANQAKQVVLIGDHRQLRPVVLCKEAAELGLEKSMFERYSKRAVFLNFQYRMNPKICNFPSDTFYKGKLVTMQSSSWDVVEPLRMWTSPDHPHIFCNIEGEEECLTVTTEEGNQQSRSNKAELEQVMKVLTHLVKAEGIEPRNINIVSQYNAQCFAIREAIKKEKNMKCHVNTVVSSQGGEWDYIIFSTVRSLPDFRIEPNPTKGWCKQSLGFITDEHQINVALTRARKGIIIIGNSKLLRCDEIWGKLIQHYKNRGCFVEAQDFPRPVSRIRRSNRVAAMSRQTSAEFYAGTDQEEFNY